LETNKKEMGILQGSLAEGNFPSSKHEREFRPIAETNGFCDSFCVCIDYCRPFFRGLLCLSSLPMAIFVAQQPYNLLFFLVISSQFQTEMPHGTDSEATITAGKNKLANICIYGQIKSNDLLKVG
jgi:hypothetical protein